MDFFVNNEIIRNKAYYQSGEIAKLVGFKKANQILFIKYFSQLVADSVIWYDDIGNIDRKIHYAYTSERKQLLGCRQNTHEEIRSRYINNPLDVAIRIVEYFQYNTKQMSVEYRNEAPFELIVPDLKGDKHLTLAQSIDSAIRAHNLPVLEEDLTGRPIMEIASFIRSHREMRDMVSKCMSRYRSFSGQIIVEFTIKSDGTIPEVLLLKSTVPCKNIGMELMNVIQNIAFPENKKYGTATVTYPFQF